MVSRLGKSAVQSPFGRPPVWRRLRQTDIPRGSAIVNTAASIDPHRISSPQREWTDSPTASTQVKAIRRLIPESAIATKSRGAS